uniref:Putative PRXamide receptor-like protein n=1 Tax=Adineta vaga TaxID=104782 RepID=B3G4I5_ADIVA|nr:putative PRXamide receptor-like protein [Adineta vaga]
MSETQIAVLYFARKQVGIYFGIPVFIASIIGELFSIIVLLSLNTFRQNSAGFYLIVMSIFNFIRLSFSTVFIIISLSFGMNYSVSIFFFCQLRNLIATTCNMGSITCLCMAVIDQYFATCSCLRWQQWSNIKVAHRVTIIITLIWLLNGIPYVIFFDKISSTNTAVCVTVNSIFLQYHTYGYFLTYNNLIPLITIIFGFMAFQNVRNLRYRTIPLVRRELEKQLTIMVLTQTLVYVCTYSPYSVVSTISAVNTNRDSVYLAVMNLANTVTVILSVYSNGVRMIFDKIMI